MNNSPIENAGLQQSIESALAYFELFKYPLLPEDIHRFLNRSCSLSEVMAELNRMEKSGCVYCSSDGFYSRTDQPDWSEERKKGNKRAETLLRKMPRFARIIKAFPFVEAIAISGSLSKYYADEEADIDYFIITKANRLWIARTLLHLYKKFTFMIGHQHFYCMNYFVDESALEIKDKNIYTATEIVTLVPVYNAEVILQLKHQNEWLFKFLPNETLKQDERFLLSGKKGIVKSFLESMINVLPAERLNRYFMRLTDRQWRLKWERKSFPMESYDEAMFTSLHVSKNHPANFQAQVLNAIEKKEPLTNQPQCAL